MVRFSRFHAYLDYITIIRPAQPRQKLRGGGGEAGGVLPVAEIPVIIDGANGYGDAQKVVDSIIGRYILARDFFNK